MYQRLEVLSRKEHARLALRDRPDFSFASATASVAVGLAEVAQAGKQYPLVFGNDHDGSLLMNAVLGLRAGTNCFVDPNGGWRADYIPATIRLYPFALARKAGQNQGMTLCLDSSSGKFDTSGNGVALFNEDGGLSPALQAYVNNLHGAFEDIQNGKRLCAALDELGLLDTVSLQFQARGEQVFHVGNVRIVSESQLNSLSDEAFLSLKNRGYLPFIYAHLFSLSNFVKLFHLSNLSKN